MSPLGRFSPCHRTYFQTRGGLCPTTSPPSCADTYSPLYNPTADTRSKPPQPRDLSQTHIRPTYVRLHPSQQSNYLRITVPAVQFHLQKTLTIKPLTAYRPPTPNLPSPQTCYDPRPHALFYTPCPDVGGAEWLTEGRP